MTTPSPYERISERIEVSLLKLIAIYGSSVRDEAKNVLISRDIFKMIKFCDKYHI